MKTKAIVLLLSVLTVFSCAREPAPEKPSDHGGNGSQTQPSETVKTLPIWSSGSQYRIVYNPEEEENRAYVYAQNLADAIEGKYEVVLPLVAADASYRQGECDICIGGTPAAKEYLSGERDTFDYTIQVSGKSLVLAAGCAWALKKATDVFLAGYVNAGKGVPDDLKIEANCRGERLLALAPGANLRILDNNIWAYNKDEIPAAWQSLGDDPRNSFRSRQYAGMVEALLPDVFGWQEYDAPMQALVEPMIAAKYAQALPGGVPTRMCTPLYYNKETVEPLLVHYKSFPGEFNNSNSKSYCSAVFRHKPTGVAFIVVSTHLWWMGESSKPGSNAARTSQALMIANEVEDLLIDHDCPVFVMGDMNCNLSSDAMKVFTGRGYKDCGQSATQFRDSFKGHHTCSESDGWAWSPQQNDDCATAIDHIFEFNCGTMASVLTHRIVTAGFTLSLTDHCPRYVDVALKAGGSAPSNPSAPAVELSSAGTRILFIGNSFTKDAVEHLPGIVAASGFKDITMAHLFYGGRTIPVYNDWTKADYTLYKAESGAASWTEHGGTVSIAQVAKAGRWDVITIQEHTGKELAWSWTEEEKTEINQLIRKLKALQPSAHFHYILSQAYHDMDKIPSASRPYITWTDQAGMWAVIAAQGRKVLEETEVESIISTGCALQNLRTSGLQTPMDLTRDGYHMDLGTSRYTAACTVYGKLIQPVSGKGLDDNSFRIGTSNYSSGHYTSPVTDANAPVCRKAALYAIENPFEVTDMHGEGATTGGDIEPYPFTGSGTESDPYLVGTADDMTGIPSVLALGGIRHFKMTSDIDMAQVDDWTPVVSQDKAYGIDFDGNGHVITAFRCSDKESASMFGMIYGSVRNLTLRNCSVSNGSQCALLAVYGGDASGVCTATLSGIHAENCTVSMTGTAAAPVGGLIANAYKTTMTGCSFQGEVSTSAGSGSMYIGGLVGKVALDGVSLSRCCADLTLTVKGGSQIGGLVGSCVTACSVSITDCYTRGEIKGKGSYMGGIVGDLTSNSSVLRCYSAMSMQGVYNHGGIVGRASNLQNPNTVGTFDALLNISVAKCIAWNGSISTTGSGERPTGHYSSGAVVGFTVYRNPLSDCIRRPDMVFNVYENAAYNNLQDNENVSPEAPLVKPSAATYHCPYNGKAASAGQTLPQVAAALGWPSSVWDMSTDYPSLR